ncbi:MAG: hypothetical protein AB1806_11170 [Acidobacteriota bacterium]
MSEQNGVPEMSPGEGHVARTAESPAVQRFTTCRWRKAAEEGVPDHCVHRDVLPMTGTGGFDPEAWCEDCGYYKVRRTPRKRPPEQDRYSY